MIAAAVTYIHKQIGQWDQPQIVSFDSLFGKYSIESNFEKDDIARINQVVNEWKPFVQELLSRPEGYRRPVLSDYLSKMNDPPLEITTTRRTAHIVHPLTPNSIYKAHYQNSGLSPLANTLRAPMASIMNDVIVNNDLSGLGVPKKGLIAMCDKEEISQLYTNKLKNREFDKEVPQNCCQERVTIAGRQGTNDDKNYEVKPTQSKTDSSVCLCINENTINDAFIVCAEKINVLKPSETLNLMRAMISSSQEILANQCCTLVLKTGASDFTWPNLLMHKVNGKLYILDTEPLDGELLIDKVGEGFETCLSGTEVCLKDRAKTGLELFMQSSRSNRLEVFENTAQSFLEKID